MAFASGIVLGLLDLYLMGHGIDWLSVELSFWFVQTSPLGILLLLCSVATFVVLSILSFRFLL